MADISVEEFENKCMDIIEQIVAIDIRNTRKEAIVIADKMLTKAKQKTSKLAISIYERVKEEFETATDAEYLALRKQIFGEK